MFQVRGIIQRLALGLREDSSWDMAWHAGCDFVKIVMCSFSSSPLHSLPQHPHHLEAPILLAVYFPMAPRAPASRSAKHGSGTIACVWCQQKSSCEGLSMSKPSRHRCGPRREGRREQHEQGRQRHKSRAVCGGGRPSLEGREGRSGHKEG